MARDKSYGELHQQGREGNVEVDDLTVGGR